MSDGFLMPDASMDAGSSLLADTANVTREQQVSSARQNYGGNYSTASTIGGSLAFAPVDLADIVGSSVGLTDRGQISQRALQAVGHPGLADFYNQNRGAIEAVSGIAGVIAADFTAARVLQPAGWAMRTLAATRMGARLASLEARYETGLRAMRVIDQLGASRGAIGMEQYVGDVTLPRFGMAPVTVNREAVARGVRWANIARGAARNLTTEALVTATQHTNSFLFSDDVSENLLFAAGGLGLGAVIDRSIAQYAIRKATNSDAMSRAFQRAYDPDGTEAGRLRASMMEGPEAGTEGNHTHLGYLQGSFTDRATSYMVSARTLANRELSGTRELAGARERFATPQIELANNEMQKATIRGINGIPNTGFSMNAPELGNHVTMRLMEDPSSFYGIEALGAAGKDQTLTAIHETRAANIARRQTYVSQVLQDGGVYRMRNVRDEETKQMVKRRVLVPLSDEKLDAYRAEMHQLIFHNSMTAEISTGREWVPMQVGKVLEGFEEPKIRKTKSEDRMLWEVEGRDVGQGIGVANDGELFLPGTKTVDNMDFYDHLALYRTSQQALDHMVSAGEGFILPKKPSWFQLDMAENLIARTGDESLIQFPGGVTRQSAQVESLRQKITAIAKKPKIWDDPEALIRARMQYNLPALTAYESGLYSTSEHPIDVLLRGLGKDPKAVAAMSYSDILDGIKAVRKINGLAETAKDKTESLSGDMFQFLRDDQGRPIRPILGYRRPLAPFQWTKEDLAERLAMRKAVVRDKLLGGSELTKNLTQSMLDDPDFAIAHQTQGLMDVQIQSSLPGMSTAGPQTARGNLLHSVVSREWRDRDNPILQAAARIRDKGERLVRDVMRARVDEALGDVVQRINGPRNLQSSLLVRQYLSAASGWDMIEALVPTPLPKGMAGYRFALDQKSLLNQRRWKTQFGEGMPEEATLRAPNGKDIVVDELGKEFVTRLGALSDDIVKEKNSLLASQGLGQINRRTHYVPPPNTKGKYIGFTLDYKRDPVPGGTIVASTPEEFARVKSRLEQDPKSPLNQNGNVFYTQNELHDFATLWDKAQMHFIDPGTTAVQPGKKGVGSLANWDLNPNAIEDALGWVRDSYLQHGDDTMRVLFDEAIKSTEARSAIAKSVTRNNVGRDLDRQRSIYDFYLNTVKGKLGISTEASFVGRTSRNWEEKINKLLGETAPGASRVWTATRDWLGNFTPGAASKTSTKTFEKLSESLGPYMPYDSVSHMMERQFDTARPPELAKIMGLSSRFEAAMRLRILEPVMAIMNMAGIVNAIPAVIRHAQPALGETMEAYARRVGHSAQLFNVGSKQIGVMDIAKIGQRGFARAWSRKGEADYTYMLGRGFITQEVAEFQRQFGAINSKNGLMRFLTGNPHAENPIAQKGLVGWLSVLTDKSEDFSRSWGHMTGLELAETLGIEGREAQHGFAHDFANKLIANYDPKNRPEIFQGALGAPIGLFQSFIWNYYQRLFRYIETGDKRAFATQYATQASLFGVKTLPGFDAVNKMFFDHSDGNTDPYDAIYKRFGDNAGDFLMAGTLSNLPKLANYIPGVEGVPGMDLYSRGDTNVRLPGFNAPPIIDTFRRVKDAIGAGMAAFSSHNPHVTGQQLAEIASNMITNRPIAGFIEQAFAGGYDTDRYGQVAAESHGAMESVYRVMGTRSLRQSKELEAFYTNRNQNELQNALMSDLRTSVRASLRANDVEAIPQYFERYIHNGGDPARFNRWIRDNFDAARNTRAERQLHDVLRDPNAMSQVNRLLDAEVSNEELENFDDQHYQVVEPSNDHTADMPPGFDNPANAPDLLNQMATDNTMASRM